MEGTIENSEVIATPAKGCYKTVEEALSPEIISRFSDIKPIDPLLPNKYIEEKKLVKNWDGAEIKVHFPEDSRRQYLINKDIGDGRKVYIIAEELGIDPYYGDRYQVEKIIVTSNDGKNCVEYVERAVPEGVNVQMVNGVTESDKTNRLGEMSYDPEENTIFFKKIKTLTDVACLWHEAGHAHHSEHLSDDEKKEDIRQTAFAKGIRDKLFKYGLSGMKAEEKKEGLCYLTTRHKTKESEQYASDWALDDIKLVKDYLGVDEMRIKLISDSFEEFYQSYDTPFLPGGGNISSEAASFPLESKRLVWNYAQRFEKVVGYLDKLTQYSNTLLVVSGSDCRYTIKISTQGPTVVTVTRFPNDNREKPSEFVLGATSAWQIKLPSITQDNQAAIAFNKISDFKEKTKNPEIIIGMVEELQNTLKTEVAFKEVWAGENLPWLKAEFSKCIDDIDSFDIGMRRPLDEKGDLILDGSRVEAENLSLISKSNHFCNAISQELIYRCGMDKKLWYDQTINPLTKKLFADEYDRLVSISEYIFLQVPHTASQLPDRYNLDPTKKQAVERQIIKTAVNYMIELKRKTAIPARPPDKPGLFTRWFGKK